MFKTSLMISLSVNQTLHYRIQSVPTTNLYHTSYVNNIWPITVLSRWLDKGYPILNSPPPPAHIWDLAGIPPGVN